MAFASAVLLLAGAEAMRGRSLAQERMTEEEATRALLHGDAAQRHEAAAFALEVGAAASLELKKALLQAAWREARNRSPGEAFITYSFAVADMMDTIAISYLLEVMKHGPIITNSLADYGRTALGPALKVVADSSADYDDVDAALETLRFMIEDGWMSAEERAVVEEIAWESITVPGQHWFVVSTSIQLALALGTPELRGRVEELAFDLSALYELSPSSEQQSLGRTGTWGNWV